MLVIFHSLLYLTEIHQVTYKDYTANLFTPSFSHHKLTCFEYADGANAVRIKDSFIDVTSTSTDLDMYYQKVGDVYDAVQVTIEQTSHLVVLTSRQELKSIVS